MLQQTQVITVKAYFERFIERFPNVKTLASAPLDDVLKLWDGLGYYSRARNLHRGAQQIQAAGGFPQTHAGWLEIPGVGPYTAGAISSIALNLPTAIVDGNVERVLSRFFLVPRTQTDHKAVWWNLSERVLAAAVVQKIAPSNFNQALMELGALVCIPKRARCEACPLREAGCQAFARGLVEEYPGKKPRAAQVKVSEERHAVVRMGARGNLDGAEVRLVRNAEGTWRAGLWDFAQAAPRGAKAVGSFEVQYVVTNHKIRRTVRVWRVGGGAKYAKIAERKSGTNPKGSKDLKDSTNSEDPLESAWESLAHPERALGAAVKKSWSPLRSLVAK